MLRFCLTHRAGRAYIRSPWPVSTSRKLHDDTKYGAKNPLPEIIGHIDVSQFRKSAYDSALPLVMRRGLEQFPVHVPALEKWFVAPDHTGDKREFTASFTKWAHASVEYEVISPDPTQLASSSTSDEPLKDFLSWLERHAEYHALGDLLRRNIQYTYSSFVSPSSDTKLVCFSAPLVLLFAALEHRDAVRVAGSRRPFTQLYIAQSSIDMLPAELQADLPTPALVRQAGKGDVYGTSIWLGLEPTLTPLHRDPNPNIFCQLCGSKRIRMIPPAQGAAVFYDAQRRAGNGAPISPLLGVDMMTGVQKRALDDAVWGEDVSSNYSEARLQAGDALFIPKGWWHSVKSFGSDGLLNGSVNWWFR